MLAAALRAADRAVERRPPHRDTQAPPRRHPAAAAGHRQGLRERSVPLHEEAAQAIRDLIKLREAQDDKGIYDPDLGRPVRYLFLRNGVLANPDYLFASPLARICEELAIFNGEGKPAIHAHRFRQILSA